MALLSSLNRSQKEAISLLQIGTFLEFFDLMLYIHMAVLLNEIFFPKTDPKTAALLSAFTFCSTYVFQPIGALLFGWLGDNVGRKSTLIITTFMMSVSCLIMANLPTYSQIGITAAWIMIICRMAQGMSSLGEIVGAQIYVTESIPRPTSYPAVASITIAATVGATVAIGIAALVTSFYMNWRIGFWIGALIAIVGGVARTRLRETQDFLNLQRSKLQASIKALKDDDEQTTGSISSQKHIKWKEPVKKKTLVAYFLIHCGYPLSFYLGYIYFNPLLKNKFGYTAETIIQHNFYLSMFMIVASLILLLLSTRFHPLKILRIRWVLTFTLILLLPFLISAVENSTQLFCIQASLVSLNLTGLPADAVFYYHLPIFRRFTFATFLYALSRALMYIITAFGLVYLGMFFGDFGLWVLTIPISIAYLFGVFHFEELEHKLGYYPDISPISAKGIQNKVIRMLSLKDKNNKERRKHGVVLNSKS
jgi:MFS transporter, MHS family, proline/betaine transporter